MIRWIDGAPRKPSSHWHPSDLDFIDKFLEETLDRLSTESLECIQTLGQR